jgi:ribosome-associated protein
MARKRRPAWHQDEQNSEPGDEQDGGPKSKSQVKRDLAAVQDLALRLLNLSVKQLAQIPLLDETREALLATRDLERRARQRQLRFTSGLLAREDVDAVTEALEKLLRPHGDAVRVFHDVEDWRDRLLAGETELIDTLGERFAQLDRQQLVQLLRSARQESERGQAPKAARQLFRMLVSLRES